MTRRQAEAVRAWWTALDPVDRGRVLRNDDDDLLAEDLALSLVEHGVTVIPAFQSPVDGRPEGWFWPPALEDLVAQLRGDPAPPGPGGRLCHECGQPVVDGEDYVEVPLLSGLSYLLHAECAPTPRRI